MKREKSGARAAGGLCRHYKPEVGTEGSQTWYTGSLGCLCLECTPKIAFFPGDMYR